ncbi:UNVERIFIED_CONTAM: hypothetical protein GTU68_051225 [Idotea baltica]|nr:hypothetical protein [Idotea baltica]
MTWMETVWPTIAAGSTTCVP